MYETLLIIKQFFKTIIENQNQKLDVWVVITTPSWAPRAVRKIPIFDFMLLRK